MSNNGILNDTAKAAASSDIRKEDASKTLKDPLSTAAINEDAKTKNSAKQKEEVKDPAIGDKDKTLIKRDTSVPKKTHHSSKGAVTTINKIYDGIAVLLNIATEIHTMMKKALTNPPAPNIILPPIPASTGPEIVPNAKITTKIESKNIQTPIAEKTKSFRRSSSPFIQGKRQQSSQKEQKLEPPKHVNQNETN